MAKAGIPCSSGAGGVGSIPANSEAQNVQSFCRWRFEMKLGPFIMPPRVYAVTIFLVTSTQKIHSGHVLQTPLDHDFDYAVPALE